MAKSDPHVSPDEKAGAIELGMKSAEQATAEDPEEIPYERKGKPGALSKPAATDEQGQQLVHERGTKEGPLIALRLCCCWAGICGEQQQRR